ncbi:hypothetical protein EON65_55930 [archaeon]|nr:MAG: hypothetical protein EON65_55930 [archaeon]
MSSPLYSKIGGFGAELEGPVVTEVHLHHETIVRLFLALHVNLDVQMLITVIKSRPQMIGDCSSGGKAQRVSVQQHCVKDYK